MNEFINKHPFVTLIMTFIVSRSAVGIVKAARSPKPGCSIIAFIDGDILKTSTDDPEATEEENEKTDLKG